jgi:NADH-quinone oxidoreductase subunit G
VRFGQEIAGVMELGMIGRGEHAEIVSFVGKAVDSELSGNMIDLCPVGALTSEPFRYSARTWELTRRKSVSPHDGLGSNLVVQVKQNRVMRVLPLENEAVNECWLSDKDRFSYEGVNSDDRLRRPMVKKNGAWQEVDWEEALDFAAENLQDFGVLASPHSTLEELYLAGKLAQGGNSAADFRLRQSDFSGQWKGIPWLGMPIAELHNLDRVLVVGSFLRKEHPLVAHRLRQAAKRGTQVHMLHSVDDDWLMRIKSKKIVAPSQLVNEIGSFKEALSSGKNAAVLLGNFAQQHPQFAQIVAAAQALGAGTNMRVGILAEAANTVGGYLAGLPVGGNVGTVLAKKRLVLLNTEPELDCADPRAATRALQNADFVVSLTAYKTGLEYADVLLPITAFTETAGTFVSMEGRVQSFYATVNPLGDARPGWKVLRVLGTMLGRPGCELDTVEQVRDACLNGRDVAQLLSNEIKINQETAADASGIQRIADVPIYFADPLVRRSPPLQRTKDAWAPKARMNARLMTRLGLSKDDSVLVRQEGGQARLKAALDERVPDDCVRVAAAHPSTASLGAMFGAVEVEKAG